MGNIESPSPTPTKAEWSLGAFRLDGYDKGRGVLWQAAWFAVLNLCFMSWWCPGNLRIALLRIFGADVGNGVIIRHRVRILWPWKLSIGDNTWIGEGAWLLNLEPIQVGDDVCISQEAYLCTGSHNYRDPCFLFDNAPIRVGDNSWIATQAMILRGVTLGQGTLVGARAVVTRSLSPGAIVPAGTRA